MTEFAGLESDQAKVEPKFVLAAINRTIDCRVLILSE